MANDWDPVFKALADRHRRAILSALCRGSRPASDLARLAGLAMNAVSFHLRWLKSAGLVSVERKGRWRWYRAEANHVAAWLAATRDVFEVDDKAIAKRKPRARPRRPIEVGPSQVRGENVATDTLPDVLL